MADLKTNFTNGAETTLSSTLAAGATTINVVDASTFPAVPFRVVIDPGEDAKREEILVDGSKTGTSFTLSAASSRGQSGTSDVEHSADAVVAFVPTAGWYIDLHDRIDANDTALDARVEEAATDASGFGFVLDEDNFASNSATKVPTQQSAKAYVDDAISSASYVPSGSAVTEVINTFETTTSTSPTALATVGPDPTVTVGSSGVLLVQFQATMRNQTAGEQCYMGFTLSGANSLSAGVNSAITWEQDSVEYLTLSASFLLTGLTAGDTTVSAQYWVFSGTGQYGRRSLIALPL